MTVAESVLDLVRVGMRGLKAPGFFDKVYKDECMYSFDTPESPGGLYVNLKSCQVHHLILSEAVWHPVQQ
jgi:ubiquitin carboxyl-terminal hydrolase 5/13